MPSNLKKHRIYCLVLLILTAIFYSNWLNTTTLPALDHVTFYHPRELVTKEMFQKYNSIFPLWNPYWESGTPFFAKADYIGFNYPLNWMIAFLSPTATYKLMIFADILLAGITMYFLVFYLYKNEKAAFIAALVYLFNGWIVSRSLNGHLTSLNGYWMVPLVLALTIQAFKSKNWFFYSVSLGILIALLIFGNPDLKVFLFAMPMIAIYALFFLIGPLFKKRLLKAAAILTIVLVVALSLTAVKILPTKELLDLTSREHLTFEQSAKHRIRFTNFFSKLIEPVYTGMPKIRRADDGDWYGNIGIFAFLLAGFAVYKRYKNKTTLFLLAISIFSIAVATASFVFWIMWRFIPPYDSFRFLDRALILFVFAGSILAGVGAAEIMEKFKKREFAVFAAISLLIVINLALFGQLPWPEKQSNVQQAIDSNQVLQYVSKQPGIFRVHTYETRGIDWGTEFYNVPLGLSDIYGYEGAWMTEYMNEYLTVANYDPVRFWGILNVKYLTSQNPINISGFKFIKKFDDCKTCFPETTEFAKAWGPYLYENTEVLPRVYIVKNSVLIIGEKDTAKQFIYSNLILNPAFNPGNTVIILGRQKVGDYSISELKKYSAIILAVSSLSQSEAGLLESYINLGGSILPDIAKNKQSISKEDIGNLLSAFKGQPSEAEIKIINPNTYEIKPPKTKGFLVYSEKIPLYPGWSATADGEKTEILRADGVIAAVYVNDNDKVILKYLPKTFVIGAIISLIALLLVVIYYAYKLIKNAKGKQY